MSNTDKRLGRKIPAYVRREDSPGLRLDSGPYIGKIKNNLDTLRTGRLEVWIPDLGGLETEAHSWRTVNYASPFFGSTNYPTVNNEGTPGKKNEFDSVKHTYGMWFTPPDVDNFVICTFIAGDPMRGFWFACVPSQLGHYMVPAIAGSKNVDSNKIKNDAAKEIYESGNSYPVVEFNENTEDPSDIVNFTKTKKPLHEYQLKILGNQGLDKDTVRGIITSSSQRESPSAVFGISTPGRPLTKKPVPSSGGGKNEQDIDTKFLEVHGRRGGHTFVMDDGDYQGKDQLMRFRTAGGHQILLNDTEETIYISNSTGNVWIEMTGTGNLNVFSEQSVSFRAKEGFNFHTEKDFIVQADGNIQFKSKKTFTAESDTTNLLSNKKTTIFGGDVDIGSEGKINLESKNAGSFTAGGDLILYGSKVRIRSGKGPEVKKPNELETKNFNDAEKDGDYKWKSTPEKIKSIVDILPTHEPWPRPPKPETAAEETPAASVTTTTTPTTPAAVAGGTVPVSRSTAVSNLGINRATGQSIKRPVDASYLNRSDNPTPPSGIGSLSPDDIKALKTQIAYSESGFKYDAVEARNGNFLGKYQIGAAALVDQGLIKPDAYKLYGTAAVRYPSSWTGGIGSKEEFLNNPAVQEKVMDNLLERNYSTMLRTGGIKSTDDPSTVAGMLSTSHLLGAGGATKWRNTGLGADANNTTGTSYFNQGRYALEVLAKKG